MEKYLDIIKKSDLFYNLKDKDIIEVLSITNSYIKEYTKNSTILRIEDTLSNICLVLDGNVIIERLDYNGNSAIVSKIGVCGLFGEAFVFSHIKKVPVNVISKTDTKVLCIPYDNFLNISISSPQLYKILSTNMFTLMAKKLIFLNQKVNILEKQTIREKILAYLEPYFIKHKNETFSIPFDRQQLANYLSVNRSALSRELSDLKKDGLIDYDKNHFKKTY